MRSNRAFGSVVSFASLGLILALAGCSEEPGIRRPDGGGGGVDSGEVGTPGCPDADADTICDSVEGDADLDGDGIPNSSDPDSDGDGTPDSVEAGDTDPTTPPWDLDGNGVPDWRDAEYPRRDGGGPSTADGGSIYDIDAGAEAGIVEALCPASSIVPTGCVTPVNEAGAHLCNQLDDDCDGHVDENCGCEAGAVQPCFRGPPGRRRVGACQDGMQQCRVAGEFGTWGDCVGGVAPSAEICDSLDNDCNGCRDEIEGCIPKIDCPEPGDPRVPEAAPFVDYPLRGGDFFMGTATRWMWTVEGGPCESILPRRSYTLTGENTQNAVFRPTLSGDYTVTMTVWTSTGEMLTCTWIVHVRGPGLRIEMCYPEANTQDVDLLLSGPGYSGNWYIDTNDAFDPAREVCGWHNCEGQIRGDLPSGGAYPRANWGYANSPLSECSGGPLGLQWLGLGYCANPRLDIDNNLSEGIGLPENINVDAPREGERFRVMLQNWTGTAARPMVNVYCGGRRVATYGAAPDLVGGFAGSPGGGAIGAMWRVVDVVTHVDGSGTTTCETFPLHPPGATTGYDVSVNDNRF